MCAIRIHRPGLPQGRRGQARAAWPRWLSLAMLLLAMLAAPLARAALVPMGDVVQASASANGAQLSLSDGSSLRIAFLAHDIVQIHALPAGRQPLSTGAIVLSTPADGAAELYQDAQRVYVRQGKLAVLVLKRPLQVIVLRGDGSVLSADVPGGLQYDPAGGTVVAVKYARPDEHFLGMGLAGGPLDRRGRSMVMRNTDRAAYDELTQPLYSSTPFFHGHTGGATYGLYVDNPSVMVFDFAATSRDILSIAAVGGTLDTYLMAGPTPVAVARAFGALTGTNPLPPRWALGYLQAHFGYASADQVLALAQEFRSRQIPCDAFFLDLDYTDRLFTMTWNPVTWPDPAGFNRQMEAMGFKRVNILEPLMTVFDPQWAEAAAAGWLVNSAVGGPLIANIWMGDVSFVDFTRAGARDYFKSRLQGFLATGVSGLWADLNEPAANDLPYAVFDFEGRPRYEFASRNVYALWENATLRDALVQAQPQARPFIVSRSGFPGIQRYAANWSGDTESTWDSLRVQVQIANAMGLSGQNFFGADVGGFLGAPDAELFLRWLQFGSATPFFRNHSMNTSPLREPWRYGEPYTSAARSIIEWRYRLMPYLYSLFALAESQATPVLAPTAFHFPADPATVTSTGSEFMLGPSLLVAPVFTPGAATRSVYLPAGSQWLDYYTDAAYSGGQTVSVPAPLHQLPLLVRAGSIVPMAQVRQYAAQALADDTLTLDIFTGADGSFVLHEDDGASTAYRGGAFRDTRFTWTETATTLQLTAAVTGGQQPAAARPWWLQVRRVAAPPARVLADGVVLKGAASAGAVAALGDAGGWAFDGGTQRLFVRLPGRQGVQSLKIER